MKTITTQKCAACHHPEFRIVYRDALEVDAKWLCNYLESLVCDDGGRFDDGDYVQLGWMPLRIQRDDDELVLWEPNMKMPLEWHRGVDASLKQFRVQNSALESIGRKGLKNVPSAQHAVSVSKDVKPDTSTLILERLESTTPNDSGWIIANAATDNDEFRGMSLYEAGVKWGFIVPFFGFPVHSQIEVSVGKVKVWVKGKLCQIGPKTYLSEWEKRGKELSAGNQDTQ